MFNCGSEKLKTIIPCGFQNFITKCTFTDCATIIKSEKYIFGNKK